MPITRLTRLPGYTPLPSTESGAAAVDNRRANWLRLVLLASLGLIVLRLAICIVPSESEPFAGLQLDAGWRPFYAATAQPAISASPTLAQKLFDEACAERWIAKGELCRALHGKLGEQTRRHIDVIIPWVNGSASALAEVREALGAPKGSANRFREHQELIHNVRSVLQNMPRRVLRRIYILTADLPLPADQQQEPDLDLAGEVEWAPEIRMGQVPTWLELKHEGETSQDGPELHVLHHSEFIRLRGNVSNEAQVEYRNTHLPTFNSMAIESALGNIPDLSENVLYMNDDIVVLRRLKSADLSTPLYGPQFRVAIDQRIGHTAGGDPDSEYPSMGFASSLLDERFGIRNRPYLSHAAKMLSTAALREVNALWPVEHDIAGSSRFRGTARDINANFLTTHYLVEKHREALLWSLIMARFDADHDGRFNVAEQQAFIRFLRDASMKPESEDDVIDIRRPRRDMSQPDAIAYTLGRAGMRSPSVRSYRTTSFDGYAYHHPTKWPSYPPVDSPVGSECAIKLSDCVKFPANGTSSFDAQSLFKFMAFERTHCGDCLVVAGVTMSGFKGMEAFLPPATAKAEHVPAPEAAPQLAPFAPSWQSADYSVAVNAGSWALGLRSYSIRLLQRYQHALGDGAEQLVIIAGSWQLERRLDDITQDRAHYHGLAYAALNDDVKTDSELPRVDKVLVGWLDAQWPTPSKWEKD